MIRRFFVSLAAMLLALPLVATDEDQTFCWACGADAECVESTEENFARKTCNSQDFCYPSGCVTLCTTGTEECAIENSGDSDVVPWWPFNSPEFSNVLILASPQESTEVVAEAFDSLIVGVLASRPLQGKHIGTSSGVIALPDGKFYRFSREVDVTRRGLVTVEYEFGRSPLKRLTIESPSRGLDIFVTAESQDGERRFEAFTFDN